jgi:hypothetical protein
LRNRIARRPNDKHPRHGQPPRPEKYN